MDDFELLRQYSEEGSQPAFRQLVEFHVGLVYSAARRQLRSPELAQEVTQAVFVELALQAGKLRSDQPLAAWLHVVTRRRAIDALRRESRRQRRELTALQMAAVDTPSSSWSGIAPLLDEAIASLDTNDRNAVVLRFFENRSLRAVGQATGLSEDAAQKRVNRALERLRKFLGRRGIATTASVLATVISTHAVETAPAGLVGAIFPAAIAAPALASSSLVSPLLMTSTQKILIAAGLVAAVGTIWHQSGVITQQRRQIAAFESQSESLRGEVHRLSARVNLLSSSAEKGSGGDLTPDQTGDGLSPELRVLLSRVSVLKQRFESDPSQKIPELRYLNDAEWIGQAARDNILVTAEDFRKALANLRTLASQKYLEIIQRALDGYLKVSQGQLPNDLAELLPYADPPLDPAALRHYQLLESGNLNALPKSAMLVSDIPEMKIDQDYDDITRLNLHSMSTTEILGDAVATARAAFQKANNGQKPVNPSQLVPYFTNPNLAKKYLEQH